MRNLNYVQQARALESDMGMGHQFGCRRCHRGPSRAIAKAKEGVRVLLGAQDGDKLCPWEDPGSQLGSLQIPRVSKVNQVRTL